MSSDAMILTNESFVISSGAGQSGNSVQTSCMIMSDGTSWSGGAVGVQGTKSLAVGNTHALAANVTFKYNVGPVVDSLNATYGPGNWTIANPKFTFQYTLYANNNRFNSGAGTFDIYWVANDGWVQGTTNPVYATTPAQLLSWSGRQSLLASENYPWTTPRYTGTTNDITNSSVWVTDKSSVRQSTNSYGLGLDSALVSDIVSSSASSNANVSLYLMATSDYMGVCIFTGGANFLPTLSFDVVPAQKTVHVTIVSPASGGSLTLACVGVPGDTYWLESATNLFTPVWEVISTNIADVKGFLEFTDTNVTNHPQRFYRLHKP